jgi:hypothetical protein
MGDALWRAGLSTAFMTEIKPRWEWRTFGTRFAHAEEVFAGLEPKGVQETDEIYLLTEKGSNVKVRAGLLDIKVLQQVNDAGLEQWIPVMKEGFPASAAVLRDVFTAMQVTPPELTRDSYTFDQFLVELIEPTAAVRAVGARGRMSGPASPPAGRSAVGARRIQEGECGSAIVRKCAGPGWVCCGGLGAAPPPLAQARTSPKTAGGG